LFWHNLLSGSERRDTVQTKAPPSLYASYLLQHITTARAAVLENTEVWCCVTRELDYVAVMMVVGWSRRDALLGYDSDLFEELMTQFKP